MRFEFVWAIHFSFARLIELRSAKVKVVPNRGGERLTIVPGQSAWNSRDTNLYYRRCEDNVVWQVMSRQPGLAYPGLTYPDQRLLT